MSDVFISYSRKDIAFARLIREALQQSQIDTWIDWERIPIGERWWQEICEAIQNANVFMLIISQNSIGSKVCKEEIDQAMQNHKRIIPIVVDDLKPETIQEFAPALPQYNWIIFERDHIFRLEENPQAAAEKPDDRLIALPQLPQFEQALEKLNSAIHTDWEWVKTHTRLQVDALRWEHNQQNPSYLIRGVALETAEQQLFRATGKEPQPSELQVSYVTASRQEETQRQAEQLQLEQKSRRRQRLVLWAVGVGLLVALILGAVAWGQRNQYLNETYVRSTAEANAVSEANNRATAEANAIEETHMRATAQAVAEEQRQEAIQQRNFMLGRQLAMQSLDVEQHQPDLAALLSVVSVQLGGGAVAENALLRNITSYPRMIQVLQNPRNGTYPYQLQFSPDGRWLAANGPDGQTSIWLWTVDSSAALIFVPVKQPLYSGNHVSSIFFSADSQQLVVVTWEEVLLYNLGTFEVQTRVTDEWFNGVNGSFSRFAPDGKELVAENKGTLYFWNPKTDHMRTLIFDGLEDAFIYIDPTFTVAAVGLDEIKIAFYDVNTGKPLENADTISNGYSQQLEFSPDGKTLLVTNSAGEVSLWDVATQTMFYERLIVPGSLVESHSALFAPYGSIVAVGNELGKIELVDPSWTMYQDDKYILWENASLPVDLEFLREGLILTGPPSDITALAFSPDGRFLVSATSEGSIFAYEIQPRPYAFSEQSFSVEALQETHSTAAFLEGEQPLVAIGGCVTTGDPFCLEGGFQIWDLTAQIPLRAVQVAHAQEVDQMAFTPDGQTLATCGADQVILLWDVATGKQQPGALRDYILDCEDMRFSLDGKTLAVTYKQEFATIGIVLLDLVTGAASEVPFKGIRSFAFTQNSHELVALAYGLDEANKAWSLFTLNLADGQMAGEPLQVEPSNNIALDTSANFLVVWSQDTIYAYDWNEGIQVGAPVYFQEDLVDVEIKPGSHVIGVTVFHPNKAFTLMDMDSAQIIGSTFKPSAGVNTAYWFVDEELFFRADGGRLLLIEPRRLTVYNTDTRAWQQIGCRIAGRDFTQAEWQVYLSELPYEEVCQE